MTQGRVLSSSFGILSLSYRYQFLRAPFLGKHSVTWTHVSYVSIHSENLFRILCLSPYAKSLFLSLFSESSHVIIGNFILLKNILLKLSAFFSFSLLWSNIQDC